MCSFKTVLRADGYNLKISISSSCSTVRHNIVNIECFSAYFLRHEKNLYCIPSTKKFFFESTSQKTYDGPGYLWQKMFSTTKYKDVSSISNLLIVFNQCQILKTISRYRDIWETIDSEFLYVQMKQKIWILKVNGIGPTPYGQCAGNPLFIQLIEARKKTVSCGWEQQGIAE